MAFDPIGSSLDERGVAGGNPEIAAPIATNAAHLGAIQFVGNGERTDAPFDERTNSHGVRAPPHVRAALAGGHGDAGLSYDEIAEALDIPLGTVKSRMKAMLGRLREEMDKCTAN